MHERAGFAPWRYRTSDYEAFERPASPLTGTAADAVWDAGLRSALEHRGVRVEEEQFLEQMLADLADG